MKRIIMLAAILALAAGAADAKSCKDPKTGKFVTCPAAASSAPSSLMSSAKPTPGNCKGGKAPHCTKGKPCGCGCIAVSDTCHK